jgi:hypothetical protein
MRTAPAREAVDEADEQAREQDRGEAKRRRVAPEQRQRPVAARDGERVQAARRPRAGAVVEGAPRQAVEDLGDDGVIGRVVVPQAIEARGRERAPRVALAEVVGELLEPAPVALARAEVLALVAAEALAALDGEQPGHGREGEQRLDEAIAREDGQPAH